MSTKTIFIKMTLPKRSGNIVDVIFEDLDGDLIKSRSFEIIDPIASGEQHEKEVLQLIDERDEAAKAMSHAYYLIIGESPEWSNLFGYKDALEEIKDAQEVLRKLAKPPVVHLDEDKLSLNGECGVSKRRSEQVAWKVMLSAFNLCPTHLSQLDRMRWITDYFLQHTKQPVVQPIGEAIPIRGSRDWEEDCEQDNGNYLNRCSNCQQSFFGHKRRITCKQCSRELDGSEREELLLIESVLKGFQDCPPKQDGLRAVRKLLATPITDGSGREEANFYHEIDGQDSASTLHGLVLRLIDGGCEANSIIDVGRMKELPPIQVRILSADGDFEIFEAPPQSEAQEKERLIDKIFDNSKQKLAGEAQE